MGQGYPEISNANTNRGGSPYLEGQDANVKVDLKGGGTYFYFRGGCEVKCFDHAVFLLDLNLGYRLYLTFRLYYMAKM